LIKQKPARKIRQACKNLIILLAEMRLKVKEGTHKTSVNVRLAEMTTVPVCVTGTTKPFGSLKNVETTAVIVVKRDGQLII
jgi:hypothetical protein